MDEVLYIQATRLCCAESHEVFVLLAGNMRVVQHHDLDSKEFEKIIKKYT